MVSKVASFSFPVSSAEVDLGGGGTGQDSMGCWGHALKGRVCGGKYEVLHVVYCSHLTNPYTFLLSKPKHGVNDLVSRWIWMSGLTDTWMTPQEQYGGILCFCLRFKKLSHFTSFVLDLAAALFTPEKCFVTSKTSPTPPSAQCWVDNESNSFFGVNYPFKIKLSFHFPLFS